jgi:2-desacetyl-2-hydroxyethyl bacteriochlorophyllide A dehydrogenase
MSHNILNAGNCQRTLTIDTPTDTDVFSSPQFHPVIVQDTMEGIWLENNTLTHRADLAMPQLGAGDALVRVRLAGICGTDLELVNGYYPFTGIPGHEFVGQIVRAPTQPHREGQRVVGEINIACGSCRMCTAGRSMHCAFRRVLGIRDWNGAFAEYLRLPLSNLIPVPDSISNEAAVFTEPLAAALKIQEQIRIRPADRVLVLGAGRLGQLIARTLALRTCELSVVARHVNQRRLLSAGGICCMPERDVPAACYDIVVEATGSPEGFHQARKAVRPQGTIVLKSTYRGELPVNVSAMVVDEITLVGSRCGAFAPALQMLQNQLLDPQPLIDARYALQDALEAFRRAAQPGALKVVICNVW